MVGFVYDGKWATFSYGCSHPMKPHRLRLVYELSKAIGLLPSARVAILPGRRASVEEVLTFHDREYLDALREADSGRIPQGAGRFGLGWGDNPAFEGVLEWSLLVTGASIMAAEAVAEGRFPVAFNTSGGLHHAMRSRASGFCYINDPVLAIHHLLDRGMRVAYIDIDAHHGDGVQWAFYESKEVLTVSLHERGDSLFPGTGWVDEIGEGEGRGYSANLPLPPGTNDALYLRAFREVVPPLIEWFKPDAIVTQLGIDTLHTDPLTHLSLSLEGFRRIVEEIKALDRPWIALGGGGYDVEKVAKGWTMALGVMAGEEVPEEIGEDLAGSLGFREKGLVDRPPPLPKGREEAMWKAIEREIRSLKALLGI